MVAEQNSVKPETETAVQTAISNAEQASVDSFSGPARFDHKFLLRQIDSELSVTRRVIDFLEFARESVIPVVARCSDSLAVSLTCGIPYFYVYNRDDLQALMTLAPQWRKEKTTRSIEYIAKISGVNVYLKAFDNALPPTCRVIKTTKRVEAHDVTEETIMCEVGA